MVAPDSWSAACRFAAVCSADSVFELVGQIITSNVNGCKYIRTLGIVKNGGGKYCRTADHVVKKKQSCRLRFKKLVECGKRLNRYGVASMTALS